MKEDFKQALDFVPLVLIMLCVLSILMLITSVLPKEHYEYIDLNDNIGESKFCEKSHCLTDDGHYIEVKSYKVIGEDN